MGRTFARAVVDYATLNQLSLWKVLSQVIRYRRFLRSTKHFTFYRLKALTDMHAANTLASREIVLEYETSLLSRDIHPWMHNVRELPSGSLMLIWSLITATSTWLQSPFGGADGDLFITPLASQPLVEAFWKIPSRFHFYGGETAAVARTAFATELTADILNRGTSKGTPGLWAQEVISRNRSFVRDVLLDGILSEQRILDRKKIEDALSGDITNSQIVVADILIQLYIECWLRGWTEVARKAVA